MFRKRWNWNNNFREFKWGDSLNKVKLEEKSKLITQIEKGLVYEGTLATRKTKFYYVFNTILR